METWIRQVEAVWEVRLDQTWPDLRAIDILNLIRYGVAAMRPLATSLL